MNKTWGLKLLVGGNVGIPSTPGQIPLIMKTIYRLDSGLPPMLEIIFNGANGFALPFWVLMILLPGWKVTRQVMQPLWPIAVLAGVYLYLLVTGFDRTSLETFSDPQLSLSDLTQLFAQPQVMAAGWVHYIVMDLFVGRWIYLEGQNKQIWTSYSLLLCLFAGPVGLLSHLLTVAVVEMMRQKRLGTAAGELSNPGLEASKESS